MKNLIYNITFICILMFSISNVFSQVDKDSTEKSSIVIVKMNNGDEYRGHIIERNEDTVILKTENGEIHLISLNVKSIKEDNYVGEFGYANPHDTRYYFGPSAIQLKRGRGYYQNMLVVGNFFGVGITNNISIGGGFEFTSTILGEPIWFLSPKVGFEIVKNIHIGGGFISVGVPNNGAATLGYGVVTLGSSETNLSLGSGWGYVDHNFSDYPAIMISATHRIARNIALLTENYILPSNYDTFYLGIHGIRILTKKSSFDIGVLIIPGQDIGIPALPFVGYARAF